jgi:hypothetical protein
VRAWLIRAPWWVLSLVTGGFFGLLQVLDHRVRQGESWGEALVVGLLGGLFFGALMGPILARVNRRYREAAGEHNVDRLSRLGWRGWRAKVSDDPELREAARRVTLLQRDQLLRQRRWAIPVFVVVIAMDVWLAFASSPWWLLAAVVPAAILVGNLVMPGRLERRAEELRDPEVGGP